MNQDAARLVLAFALGWMIHAWWKSEREWIAYEAAAKAREDMEGAAHGSTQTTAPTP